ncbi:unnamed protein product [Ambrosiozyma monospora]|uniref:Unnamed protein product n=1 Tax=Ambrosiozyma monospora TaxID=43982 RepID=A0ACB5T6W3_AMBMO|nr:unnamed protein product [Ambrosiozyma monospora]
MSSDSSNIQLTMGSSLGDGSRKRRRLNHGLNIRYAISDNLSLCNSLTEFVMMSTEVGGTPNVNVMITCLQLFTLRLSESCSSLHLKSSQSNLDFLLRDCNGVLNHFLKLFDLQDNNYNIWVLTCLYLILSMISDVESADHEINIRVKNINKLIKYSLEFLRIQNLSKAASLVLCAILQAHLRSKISLLEIDFSILQQYETVIDISEINGPALLCKESVIFWSNTFDLCKIFKFKNIKLQAALPSDLPQLFSSKVINWLLSKFNQLEGLESTTDIESVCLLISWLSGWKSPSLTNRSLNHPDQFYYGDILDIHYDYKKKAYLKEAILLQVSEESIFKLRHRDIASLSQISCDPAVSEKLLNRLLSFIEEIFEGPNSSKSLLYSWSICGLDIYTKLKDNGSVSMFASSLGAKIPILISDELHGHLHSNSKDSFDSLLDFIDTFLRLTENNQLLIDTVNTCESNRSVIDALMNFMNTDFSTNRREPKGFEDLGVVREQNTNEFDDTTTTYNIRTLSRIQTPEQRLFKYANWIMNLKSWPVCSHV